MKERRLKMAESERLTGGDGVLRMKGTDEVLTRHVNYAVWAPSRVGPAAHWITAGVTLPDDVRDHLQAGDVVTLGMQGGRFLDFDVLSTHIDPRSGRRDVMLAPTGGIRSQL
jgi:hypothetical protein